ncbi:histone deacetylase 4-like isoform X3 [Limulus polyphemus]|nr:histone deacetylase 4-like isoform X3 [Limulus polyphemus]XP_022251825.1 histone deacetylase 4-like isoform X3 [Limulus polyphemus]XP_022251826.1 histone deacetylase 4-like isoform X3 [Limulus polyphemus]XP_022251827.1 histone deacetylase 4-like isoform X3 [Limulus polyphemus]
MEINSAYSHIQRKDIIGAGYVGDSRMIQEQMEDFTNNLNNSIMNQDKNMQFQQQLLQLKQQQHIQQQLLLQHFQQQQQQLAEQHEQQIQERIKEYLEQQKRIKDQKLEIERRENEKLESLKQKEKHEQSAVASSEVKQRLQEFVLSKRQREAAVGSTSNSPPNLRDWSRQYKSLDQGSTSTVSSRCRHPLLGKYDDDFPLRKTASEPNLKVRSVLKQKVIERRSSPLLRCKDKGATPVKRRPSVAIDGSSSKSDSGPGSPPEGASIHSLHSSNGSTPIQEEPGSPYILGYCNDMALYSSPSMPNITLGRPPVPTSSTIEGKGMSEAQVRAMAAARLGVPLTSHMLHSSLPFYPSLPVIDGEFTPLTSPSYIQQHIKTLEQARNSGQVPQICGAPSILPGMYMTGNVITDAQVAQARLHRNILRPLGRTQSAPLPLGHPILQPQGIILSPQQNDQLSKEKHLHEQQLHNLLKQHIRQTVLTRASSKNQVENVEEETEAAVAQEMKDAPPISNAISTPEIIDLTEHREKEVERDSELAKQQRDREAFLQQQRDIMAKSSLQISEGSAFTPRHHVVRPLSRALSSPLVTLSPIGNSQEGPVSVHHAFTTGLVYDSLMLKHQCICGDNYYHPEHGGRLQSIWARLQETGLVARCERVRSRKASLEELQTCHSEAYTMLFGTNPLNRHRFDMSRLDLPIKNFVMLSCGGIGIDSDTIWNELHTASASRMAAGCVTELALKVATGEVKNGFAVVRPPGHHAEPQQAMGFCFFNSIAVAAKQLRQRLKLEKILIVDWDVHHGNGIQQIFYDDPHFLYISLHRHDDGNFFPGTGDPLEVGIEDGIGFTVNIAWSGALNPPIGDAEYIAAFRTLVMPIARDFDPEIVLVAAGFDAANGHPAPLGGYTLSPACFGYLTKQLMTLSKGRVVLALEGGYDLPSICDCSQECVMALLEDEGSPLQEEEITRKPSPIAVNILQQTISIQAPHWPCIKRWAPTVGYSLLEAQQKEREEVDTITALASLSMTVPHGPHIQRPEPNCSTQQVEEPMDEDQDQDK